MRFRLLSTTKQQLLYGVAVLVSILSVFSIIFMFSYYSDDPAAGAFPSSSPSSAFTQQLQGAQQDPRVAGAQTQKPQILPPASTGPQMPSPKPSPSPSPSPTPTPTSSPSPSPSPSPTQTPTPTSPPSPSPSPTPTQSPTPSPSPSPSPTPTPSPSPSASPIS